ncbi:MAG: DUF739 family protein [Eubacteriales bacterium]
MKEGRQTRVRHDYSKLKGRIVEKMKNQTAFAHKLGLSQSTVSQKLNNIVDFTQSDIEAAIEALDIPKSDIVSYFFTTMVQ